MTIDDVTGEVERDWHGRDNYYAVLSVLPFRAGVGWLLDVAARVATLCRNYPDVFAAATADPTDVDLSATPTILHEAVSAERVVALFDRIRVAYWAGNFDDLRALYRTLRATGDSIRRVDRPDGLGVLTELFWMLQAASLEAGLVVSGVVVDWCGFAYPVSLTRALSVSGRAAAADGEFNRTARGVVAHWCCRSRGRVIGSTGVTFDPAWRTSTVAGLADPVYRSLDLTCLPVLADALQDAGCDLEPELTALRHDPMHATLADRLLRGAAGRD